VKPAAAGLSVPSPSVHGTPHLPSAVFDRIRRTATSGLAWGVGVAGGLAVWILFGLGGAAYYAQPPDQRASAAGHALLRPSGMAGQSFGLVGALLMLAPFVYMARKRLPILRNLGTVRGWLEVHLFCGIVGPVLVTFHTAFKFNGIISAAYWSMVVVVLSGFAGRHLYVRIPRSMRGIELTRTELDDRAEDLREELADSVNDRAVTEILERFSRSLDASLTRRGVVDYLFGEVSIRRQLRQLDQALRDRGVADGLRASIHQIELERSLLLCRAADLQRTKQLFKLWHVFHLPLVYLLLGIATLHIALALYMGYVPFRR
jgi:hypothetical protein